MQAERRSAALSDLKKKGTGHSCFQHSSFFPPHSAASLTRLPPFMSNADFASPKSATELLVGNDRIIIDHLLVKTIIGVNSRERQEPQTIRLVLTLWTDLATAGDRDQLEHTTDYHKVCQRIHDFTSRSKLYTLEALATKLAQICVFDFPRVYKVRVRVEKPSALPSARAAVVQITRDRAFFLHRGVTGTPPPPSSSLASVGKSKL